MYGLAKRLIEKGVKVTAVLGFNGSYDVFYEEEFKKLCPTYISTMDGTYGTKGTVIDAIKENNLTFDHYYACGPYKRICVEGPVLSSDEVIING